MGFTPAYAGNTDQLLPFLTYPQVHPRIRGEYAVECRGRTTVVGSPPHTRGIRPNPRSAVSRWGFTPAYAGNTQNIFVFRVSFGFTPAYAGNTGGRCRTRSAQPGSPPHTRGIHAMAHRDALAEGSPPHTRGIPVDVLCLRDLKGFTPAYAGNTKSSCSANFLSKVHPRIRGEYLQRARAGMSGKGSPPHTRGILKKS